MMKTLVRVVAACVPPLIAVVHISAVYLDLLHRHRHDIQGDHVLCGTVGFAFLLALFDTRVVSYTGASCLSLFVHTLGAAAAVSYNGRKTVAVWENEDLVEHLVWILFDVVVVLVLLCQQEPRDRRAGGGGVDGLPPGAILCFYFDNGKSKSPWRTEGFDIFEDFEECRTTAADTKEVWVKAGYGMNHPERLVVSEEKEQPDGSEKRPSSPVTHNTPTVSPPTSPPRFSSIDKVDNDDGEKVSVTCLLDDLNASGGEAATEERVAKGTSASEKVKGLHAELLADNDNDDNHQDLSLLPTIREARGLINDMLAKSARSKEKVA